MTAQRTFSTRTNACFFISVFFFKFIFVALVERILVDCHGIVVVADFVVLALPDASQPNDDDGDGDVVAVVADGQALHHVK